MMISFPKNILEPLRKFLVSEEVRLKRTRARLEKEDPYGGSWDREADDAAIDSEVMEQVDHDRVEAEKKEASRALIRVKKTLARIKIGRYGICEGCGKMIDTDRLAINPTAEYCMSCERGVEKSKKSL
jgi:RNA polymerase-binding transcription factor DksA